MRTRREAAAPAAGAREERAGTHLLRKLRLLPKSVPALLPVMEQPPEVAEAFGMVVRDPVYEWNRHELYPQASNYHFLTEMAANLHAAGVRWIRLEFHAEDGPGFGAIDYRKYDWFINVAAPRFGLKILALLGTGILKGPGSTVVALQAKSGDIPGNAYMKAWTTRALEIARRYGDRIHGYEILNEPNKNGPLANETGGAEDEIAPDAVALLMAAIYPRLKAVQAAPVILGGLLTGSNRESERDAPVYLQEIYNSAASTGYRADEGRWPWDAIGVHPYRDTNNTMNNADMVLANLDAVYQVMQANVDLGTIWVTEIGMQAGTPPEDDQPTEGEIRQANFLNAVYTGAIQNRRTFVERLFWFKYEDFHIGHEETWGVVRLLTRGPNDYEPSGKVARRRAAFEVLSGLTPPPLPLPVVPPAAPTNLQIEVRTGGRLHLTWQAALPGTRPIMAHQLFRASTPEMHDAVHVASIVHSLDLDGRAPRGTHYYAMRALDIAVPPMLSDYSNVVKVRRLL